VSDKQISFITTTIHEPRFFEAYIENALEHGHDMSALEFLVVGDLATPTDIRNYCESLETDYGVPVTYLSVDDQRRWIDDRGLDELDSYLPYNSIQRRNIGYLRACESGADVIVSLDDDNLAQEEDIVGKFSAIGETQEVLEVTAPNDWYNCASMLSYEREDPRDVYHRGFPYSKRDEEQEYEFQRTERRVMARAGLWIDIPDIDVITHLERGPRAVELRDRFEDELVALGPGNYCPINTQNTAFHTDLMPLIHTIPMGEQIKGMEISRFDDIWLGFFAEKILHSMDETVGYGSPVSVHDRNTHNLQRELEHEAIGIRLNEALIEMLNAVEIDADDYMGAYRELINGLRSELRGDYDYEFEAYFRKMFDGMETWADACEEVL